MIFKGKQLCIARRSIYVHRQPSAVCLHRSVSLTGLVHGQIHCHQHCMLRGAPRIDLRPIGLPRALRDLPRACRSRAETRHQPAQPTRRHPASEAGIPVRLDSLRTGILLLQSLPPDPGQPRCGESFMSRCACLLTETSVGVCDLHNPNLSRLFRRGYYRGRSGLPQSVDNPTVGFVAGSQRCCGLGHRLCCAAQPCTRVSCTHVLGLRRLNRQLMCSPGAWTDRPLGAAGAFVRCRGFPSHHADLCDSYGRAHRHRQGAGSCRRGHPPIVSIRPQESKPQLITSR